MASKFNPVIRRARAVAGDVTPQTMHVIATDLRNSVRSRIQRGQDVRDLPAPPLNPKYAARKEKRGKKGIRDWDKTGRTLRSMQVLSAGPNKAEIGFDDSAPRGPKQSPPSVVAAANNKRSQQFGTSPKDMQVAENSFRSHTEPLKIVTSAA